jgi:sugar phosphate isomerase/epimerase
VKNRVVYVHASGNSGRGDEHLGLGDGTLDWRHVLDMLDLSRILKIIIEVRSLGMVEDSRRDLTEYLDREFHSRERLVMGARF